MPIEMTPVQLLVSSMLCGAVASMAIIMFLSKICPHEVIEHRVDSSPKAAPAREKNA